LKKSEPRVFTINIGMLKTFFEVAEEQNRNMIDGKNKN
jgi:hypothetical protein